MVGRQAHGRPLTSQPKAKGKSKKRALDAFAIASHQHPDRIKVRQSRLGEKEGGNRPGKRRRDEDEEEDEEEESTTKKQRKGPQKGRFDELDVDHGSDSEGNEWKLGEVDSDDDSDLDSDEAFGESDEERFEGYAFSGSTDKKSMKNKSAGRSKDMNLDEDEEEDSDSELEEGDMGEGAVDLADMLNSSSDESDSGTKKPLGSKRVPKGKGTDLDSQDDGSATSGDENGRGASTGQDEDSGSESDSDIEHSDEDSSSEEEDEDDSANPANIASMNSFMAGLQQSEASIQRPGKRQRNMAFELNPPALSGGPSNTGVTFESLGLTSTKTSGSDSNPKKSKAVLEVPLAQRQKDRLDRSAAYEKSKETLNRWIDTVKHNRRADHLMFPLVDNDMLSAQNNDKLQPTNMSKPFNELEATIQSILEESGLATANGKDDEDRIREFEELETNKLSIEEVKARRDQLRMARDLLFREEAKAKRIKKIKSRSYRKVHRKQREKEDRLNREALEAGGFVPSDDELESQDRRRAEERMGAKHRGSKWAKAMKSSGRTAWDEDVRSGVTEMARREEELRKRVEGKAVRKEFEDDSDPSSSDSDDISEDDEEAEQRRLLKQLKQIREEDLGVSSGPGSKLANMKFMKKADAARKQQNDTMVENIRKELAGEESDSEDKEVGDIGRRIFGAGSVRQEKQKPQPTNELEEPVGSDDEGSVEFTGFDPTPKKSAMKSSPSRQDLVQPSNIYSITAKEAKRRKHKRNSVLEVEDLDMSNVVTATQPQIKPKAKTSTKTPQMLTEGNISSDSEDDNQEVTASNHLPFAIRDQELIKRAFAGADVVGEFEAEKKQIIEDEDEKVVDNTIPGWGSWVGSGVSKREKKRNKGRFLSTVAGVKEKDRKDGKLEKVIINEKTVKKNNKYLANALPHPFETRQQYERSLRLPLGPEWSTKETFQDSTKPRILLKQGIIAPMSRPLM